MNWGPVFTGLGYVTGVTVFWFLARGCGLRKEQAFLLACAAFVCGIVGAKVTQAVIQGVPGAALDPSTGGRALFGGLIAGWLGFEAVKWRLGIRSSLGDAVAPALAAGEAVGRLGCHFNGCCYGSATGLPWAVVQHGAMRHPAQLYSAAFAALLFVALTKFRASAPYPGASFHAYLAVWGAGRFVLEFFRVHERVVVVLGLMQLAALQTSAFGVAFMILHLRRAGAPVR